jgi:hypothetical protein
VQRRLDELSTEYNTIRIKEDSGPERTRHMTGVLRQMMDLAHAVDGSDMVRRLDDPDRGRRLAAYAYAYARPEPEMLEPLVESLIKYSARRRSDTDNRPFGEYWGIQALANVIAKRPPQRETVDRLRQWATTIERGTDRWAEVSKLLRRLGFDL